LSGSASGLIGSNKRNFLIRRLTPVLVLAALLGAISLATLTPTAGAAPVVIANLGRKVTYYNHYGDPARGRVVATAQGQTLDTNGNGIADSLRARGAMQEVRKVRRLRIADIKLQAIIGGVWTTLQHNATDKVSEAPTAYVVQYTAYNRFCATDPDLVRTYRVVHADGIRWSDGTASNRTTTSNRFTARALAIDPDCPETPPPPPAPQADVQVTKTASVASVPGTADTNLSYTITVKNNDTTDPAGSVVVTDTLPGELVLNGALPSNCVDTDAGAPVVLRCTFGTLDPGEVNSVTINVTANDTAISDGAIDNTARVTSSTADPNLANNTSSVRVLIRPLADVSIDKEADQASVTVPGDTFRYVLRVTNAGPSEATNVTVVDTLPEGLEVVALPAGCVNDSDPAAEPDTITCTLGTLAAGASTSVSIDVVTDASRADDTLPYVNTARVTTSTYEQNTGNNSDTETTPVVPA
jgi:uncharacterized repeat protein (TIGR01451 family)